MNTSVGQPWSQAEQQVDSLALMANDLDDFANFLDFGESDFSLPNVDSTQFGDAMQHLSHPGTPFNDMGHTVPLEGISAQDFGGLDQFGMQHNGDLHQHQYNGPAPTGHPFVTAPMYQPSQQQTYHPGHAQQYHFQPQAEFPPGHQYPPTPNSFDMHGEAGRFLQQQHHSDPQHRAVLEQRFALRQNDVNILTPMVSPAGTPQFNMAPQFTMPGAYFSPLTSPMMHAQGAQNAHQHHQQLQGYYTAQNTAPNSSPTSPIGPTLDIDMMGDSLLLPESATTQIRKPRGRKMATPRNAAAGTRVRQSPIQKAQKRKSGTLSQVMTSREGLVAEAQQSGMLQPSSAGSKTPPIINVSSEDGSISPEPLSESLMGPPPRPGSSLIQSPAMTAQQKENKLEAAGPVATPKSLLSRDGSPEPINGFTEDGPAGGDQGLFEDFQLPEAAAKQMSRRPSLTQLNTQILPETPDEQTPRLSARKTPKLGPLSTPSSARQAESPLAMGLPMTASTPGALLIERRLESKGAKGTKLRSSITANGAAMVSPAIRPRISPSIKPLLPEGCKSALHSPTHALLLASKSNYQNLLEGNTLPGVNYPDSLSTGLTSKRTSHKMAEQGRRNRINDALKEMQALLPKSAASKGGSKDNSNSDDSPDAGAEVDPDSKEGKEDDAAKSSSSKAATVESANVYIKIMQQLEQQRELEMAHLRLQNEELVRRLEEPSATAVSTTKAAKDVDSASPDLVQT
ncbi:hypothetical protein LTR08_003872 [Meristemomyces frigidus]|nr:hypothetical protein LTR08_003872 [Meristemomyces frigidus]